MEKTRKTAPMEAVGCTIDAGQDGKNGNPGEDISPDEVSMRHRRPFRLRFIITACFAGGFVAQFVVLGLILAFGLPERSADRLALLLSPGITILWAHGVHSDSGWGGFVLGMVINSAYYGAILFGVVRMALGGWR